MSLLWVSVLGASLSRVSIARDKSLLKRSEWASVKGTPDWISDSLGQGLLTRFGIVRVSLALAEIIGPIIGPIIGASLVPPGIIGPIIGASSALAGSMPLLVSSASLKRA